MQIDVNEYCDRVCKEICGYHNLFSKLYFPNERPGYKWSFLFEKKCSEDCPLEQMRCLLNENGDQMVSLGLEEV